MDEGRVVEAKERHMVHGGHASKDRSGLAPHVCFQTRQHNNMAELTAPRNSCPPLRR